MNNLFPYGEWESVWDALDALFAYDQGAIDSGVSDPNLRQRCIKQLDTMSEEEILKQVSVYCRTYLTDNALAQGYGIEDAIEFYERLTRLIENLKLK